MSTARGGNQFHGSAFYAGRNDAFNANTWTNNFTGTSRPVLRQHRYGGSIGGARPVPPSLHRAKRKRFFFFFSRFSRCFSNKVAGAGLPPRAAAARPSTLLPPGARNTPHIFC